MSFHGHFWTVAPRLLSGLIARPTAPSAAFATELDDERTGRIRLGGRLYGPGRSRSILVLVHGLGGSSASPYCRQAVRFALRAGFHCLALDLRGSDGRGEDFHHAALTADLHAALASTALAAYEQVFVLGFSLGGQLAIRLAAEPADPRLRAVAAVCPPLDLRRCAQDLDRPEVRWYRRHVLGGLKKLYGAVAARRSVPTPIERLRGVDSIVEWDSLTVVPRFGFADTDDYYARASAAAVLDRLRIPALVIPARHDPMVRACAIAPLLVEERRGLEVRWAERGGHVGFPPRLDLGIPGPRGLERQVLAWLGERASEDGPQTPELSSI